MFDNFSKWQHSNLEYQKSEKKQFLKFKQGFLPGDVSCTLEKDGHRIGIIGLNSAFLQTGDQVKKRHVAETPTSGEVLRCTDGCVAKRERCQCRGDTSPSRMV